MAEASRQEEPRIPNGRVGKGEWLIIADGGCNPVAVANQNAQVWMHFVYIPLFNFFLRLVCKEWLVREDGVFAYQLQNEESKFFSYS